MSRSRTIINTSFFMLAARSFEVVSSIVVTGMLARYLGVADFGEYSLAMALVWVFVPVICMEMPRILSVELSREPARALEFLGNGFALNATIFLALALLAVAAGACSAAVPAYTPWVLLCALLLSLTQSASAVFLSRERMQFDTFTSLIVVSCLVLFSGAVIWLDLGLTRALVAAVLAYTVGLAVALGFVRRLEGTWPIPRAVPATLRRLLAGSLWLFLVQIMNQLLISCGAFILKYLSGSVDVALFQAPMRIFTRFLIVPITLTVAFLPTFSRLAMKPEARGELQGVTRGVLKLLMIASMLVAIVGFSTATELIGLVYGTDFAGAADGFRIVVLGTLFYFVNQFYVLLCMACDRIRGFVRIKFAELAACLVLNFALIPRYGHLGSLWAVTLSSGATFVLGLLFYRDLLTRKSLLDLLLVAGAGYGVIAGLWFARPLNVLLAPVLGAGGFALLMVATRRVTRDDLRPLLGCFGR